MKHPAATNPLPRIRELLGLPTQAALAKETGKKPQVISRMERRSRLTEEFEAELVAYVALVKLLQLALRPRQGRHSKQHSRRDRKLANHGCPPEGSPASYTMVNVRCGSLKARAALPDPRLATATTMSQQSLVLHL